MRFDREVRPPLGIEDQGPARDVGPEGREQTVIISRTPAQSVSPMVEGQSRDQDPVDLSGVNLGAMGTRLGDSHGTRDQVSVQIEDLEEAEAATVQS